MAQFSLVPADDGGAAAAAGAVQGKGFSLQPVDPTLSAISQGIKNQGRVTDQQLMSHKAQETKLSRIPFTHQAILAMMDNPDERKAFLEKEYGAGSVSQDSQGLIVKGKDGKPMRASSSFMASLVADAPETVLGIAGAAEGGAAGTVAGPAGSFVGAVGGAMAGAAGGKTLKEGAKAAAGVYRKTPGQYAGQVAGAAEGGAAGEIGGKVVGSAVGRLVRGPIPDWITGATPQSKAMTKEMTAAGARPPAASTMPDAKKLQRIALLADKLSGPSASIDRANKGYLRDAATTILNKAGVPGVTRHSIVTSMEGSDAALSTQETGQMIQSSAKTALQQLQSFQTKTVGEVTKISEKQGSSKITMGNRTIPSLKPSGDTAKAVEYLKQLTAPGKTPEDAYNMLVHENQTDRLEKVFRVLGDNSPVVTAVRQQALRHAFAGAMTEMGENQGMTGLSKWMNQFTAKQQDLLFPGGMKDDLKLLDEKIKFLYPGTKDPAMAGFTAGSVMQKKFYERWYHQGVGAIYRAALQQPAIINRLAVGFRGDTAAKKASETALREMFYFGAIEASEPDQPNARQPQR